MEYIYADNFRGFTDTFIKLKDVNFFVGENSTGKTSILALVKTLLTPIFWIEHKFNVEDADLGNYVDIVSAKSTDKSYFRVGLIDKIKIPDKSGKSTECYHSFLMTFNEKDGNPHLQRMTFNQNKRQTEVVFLENSIAYRKCDIEQVCSETKALELFRQWVSAQSTSLNSYSGFKSYRGKSSSGSRYLMLSLLPYPLAFDTVTWFAPIRTRPLSIYNEYNIAFSAEGAHIPYVLKKYLGAKRKGPKNGTFKEALEGFGKESGLFQSITIKEYDKRSKTSPFELDIILQGLAFNIKHVGYGVSQVLPIVVELLGPSDYFAIQQPEIHLHPKAQAALGDLIFELGCNKQKEFLIETHSDFLIDRFRMKYRNNKEAKSLPTSQILFFERIDSGNVIRPIEISPSGSISEDQPESYRGFFIREQMSLLGIS